jgi:ribosomal protein L29
MSFKDAETKPLRSDAVREYDVAALKEEINRLRDARFRLKFRGATEDVAGDNPLKFRILRRNIARIKTIIAEKERA